jgi:hypothetical protein
MSTHEEVSVVGHLQVLPHSQITTIYARNGIRVTKKLWWVNFFLTLSPAFRQDEFASRTSLLPRAHKPSTPIHFPKEFYGSSTTVLSTTNA